MMVIKLIWLAIMLVGMTWWVRRDVAAFARFGELTDTAARQRVYWCWVVQSFVILGGASVVSLWLAGGFDPFSSFPGPFEVVRGALNPEQAPASRDGLIGMVAGATLGTAAMLFVQWRRIKKMLTSLSGPADALLPRNAAEGAIGLVMSVNAGVCEELFFRLALPLLLFQITGLLVAAFVLAGVAFGLAHAYQGWKGIAVTMFVGALMTMIYLSSGSLLRVMVLHAMVDVVALVIRPPLSRWVAARAPGAPVLA